jgi:hypothetical protein
MQPEMKPVQSTYRIGHVHWYEADVQGNWVKKGVTNV